MLPKSQRLPVKEFPLKDFLKFRSGYFLVKVAQNDDLKNRYVVIIGKAAVKLATKRHFWKRKILAALKSWPSTGKDIMVIGQPSLSRATHQVIAEDLEKIRKQIFI